MEVYLLYEGDQWLSTESLRLYGVFSSKEKFYDAARRLIAQQGPCHLGTAKANGYYCDTKDEAVEIILDELKMRDSTCGWTPNYLCVYVTLDSLEYICDNTFA